MLRVNNTESNVRVDVGLAGSQQKRVDRRLRGAFINSPRASCSIYESGLMVHNCIQDSAAYNLDYFSMDSLDIAEFNARGSLRLISDPARLLKDYDFWVFNWHFVTMSSVATESIANLPGLKFTIVLELAPENPLILVPPGVFDGYIALDPAAPNRDSIFPFPRPLERYAGLLDPPRHSVPVIGSFGFGTPGKGFELLVEAVNREFDHAVIRVNIALGTHVVTDHIHRQDYPRYIASMCKRIAKPGIDVRFTYDFMSAAELVIWCAENDLNCFMYTRCQPGLAATTDQAIISGRPLLTLSNDTFRHIHQYIHPYPRIGLREALAASPSNVLRIQGDWSQSRFNDTFHEMLGAFGLVKKNTNDGLKLSPLRQSQMKVLVASRSGQEPGDVLDYSTRLADSLSRSGEFRVVRAHCDNLAELGEQARVQQPFAVLVLGFAAECERGPLAAALRNIDGPKIVLSDERPAAGEFGVDPVSGLQIVWRRPIIPFLTADVALNERSGIWLIGFSAADSNLEEIVQRIARECSGADVFLEFPNGKKAEFEKRAAALASTLDQTCGLRLMIGCLPRSGREVISVLGASRLVAFYNDPERTQELEDVSCMAMITERAVVFSRRSPFPRLQGEGVYIDDINVTQLCEMGIAAHIRVLHDFGEWAFSAKIGKLLEAGLKPARASLVEGETNKSPAMPAFDKLGASYSAGALAERETPLAAVASPADNRVSPSDEAFLHAAYRDLLGRPPDAQGLANHLAHMKAGTSRDEILRAFRESPEALKRQGVVSVNELGSSDLGRGSAQSASPTAFGPQAAAKKRKVLFVSHRVRQHSSHQYGMDIMGALNMSSAYEYEYIECSNPEALDDAVAEHAPAAVIYNYYPKSMPWLDGAITRRYSIPQLRIMHEVTQAEVDFANTEMFDFHLCPDPSLVQRNSLVRETPRLVPPFVSAYSPPATVTIGSFGSGLQDEGFDRLVTRVQHEFDDARIMLHLPLSDEVHVTGGNHALATAARCRALVIKPGIQLFVNHNYLTKEQLLKFLGGNTLNAFLYDEQMQGGISGVIDYALAAQRPIAISKSRAFRHLCSSWPSMTVDDCSLRDIIANGTRPLDRFREQWSEAKFVRAYDDILNLSLEARHTTAESPEPAVDVKAKSPGVHWALDGRDVEHTSGRASASALVIAEDWEAMSAKQQKLFYENNGFLVLPGVISREMIRQLTHEAKECNFGPKTENVWVAPSFRGLVTNSKILSALDNIFQTPMKFFKGALTISAPLGGEVLARNPNRKALHIDYGIADWPGDYRNTMSCWVNIGIYFTDLTPECEPFWVVPGSNRRYSVVPGSAIGLENDARMVLAQAGDAILFHCSTVHAGSFNYGRDTRSALFLSYRPSWSRPIGAVPEHDESFTRLYPANYQKLFTELNRGIG